MQQCTSSVTAIGGGMIGKSTLFFVPNSVQRGGNAKIVCPHPVDGLDREMTIAKARGDIFSGRDIHCRRCKGCRVSA